MLSIKAVEVEAICKMYQDPKERFYQIILAFLRQAEPPPTWRAIVRALRSPIVNLTALAKRVEAAHFPDPTASCDPPTTSGESTNTHKPTIEICNPAGEGTSNNFRDLESQLSAVLPSNVLSHQSSSSGKFTSWASKIILKLSVTFIILHTDSAGDGTVMLLATSTEEVERMIAELEHAFNNLINAIRECLKKQQVLVSTVADALTSLSPDDDEQHKMFTMERVEKLFKAGIYPLVPRTPEPVHHRIPFSAFQEQHEFNMLLHYLSDLKLEKRESDPLKIMEKREIEEKRKSE